MSKEIQRKKEQMKYSLAEIEALYKILCESEELLIKASNYKENFPRAALMFHFLESIDFLRRTTRTQYYKSRVNYTINTAFDLEKAGRALAFHNFNPAGIKYKTERSTQSERIREAEEAEKMFIISLKVTARELVDLVNASYKIIEVST